MIDLPAKNGLNEAERYVLEVMIIIRGTSASVHRSSSRSSSRCMIVDHFWEILLGLTFYCHCKGKKGNDIIKSGQCWKGFLINSIDLYKTLFSRGNRVIGYPIITTINVLFSVKKERSNVTIPLIIVTDFTKKRAVAQPLDLSYKSNHFTLQKIIWISHFCFVFQ